MKHPDRVLDFYDNMKHMSFLSQMLQTTISDSIKDFPLSVSDHSDNPSDKPSDSVRSDSDWRFTNKVTPWNYHCFKHYKQEDATIAPCMLSMPSPGVVTSTSSLQSQSVGMTSMTSLPSHSFEIQTTSLPFLDVHQNSDVDALNMLDMHSPEGSFLLYPVASLAPNEEFIDSNSRLNFDSLDEFSPQMHHESFNSSSGNIDTFGSGCGMHLVSFDATLDSNSGNHASLYSNSGTHLDPFGFSTRSEVAEISSLLKNDDVSTLVLNIGATAATSNDDLKTHLASPYIFSNDAMLFSSFDSGQDTLFSNSYSGQETLFPNTYSEQTPSFTNTDPSSFSNSSFRNRSNSIFSNASISSVGSLPYTPDTPYRQRSNSTISLAGRFNGMSYISQRSKSDVHIYPYPSPSVSPSNVNSSCLNTVNASDTPNENAVGNIVNSDKKKFQCNLCPSSFTRNHDLKRHVRIHEDRRPFVCSGCGKGFGRMDALTRHGMRKGCGL